MDFMVTPMLLALARSTRISTVGLLNSRSLSTTANLPLSRADFFSVSIASNTLRWSPALRMTICTGNPPVEPGSEGSWNAKTLLPSTSFIRPCVSPWIWSALRLRSFQSDSCTPPMLFDTPSEPLMSQRPVFSGSAANTSSHFLPNFST